MNDLAIVYGASGYTGTLISRELTRRGVRHVVAGRSDTRALSRVFHTEYPEVYERALADARVLPRSLQLRPRKEFHRRGEGANYEPR